MILVVLKIASTSINYTLTIFINAYELPDTYSIADLHYFLPE
jgi:hypothetical protein